MNTYARTHWAKRRALKLDTFTRMLAQHGRRSSPLPGKPRVEITRYSARQPDRDGLYGSAKVPIDCLKADSQGLGWIVDDSPEHCDVRVRWIKAAPVTSGRVIVEVHSE